MKCPSCFQSNPESQKFCGACGGRLTAAAGAADGSSLASYTPPHLAERILTSRSALEGERKQVTVLFCDMANSTQLAQRLGAEAMHSLLDAFFELALAEVHRLEGTMNQFLGDGFMALFGAPVAHEDHVRRALLAALTTRQRLRDAAAETTALGQVRVRMGMNTGIVVVGKIGDNLRMDYTAVGDTTNLAARLQSLAQPGLIYTSPSSCAAGHSYFDFRPIGKHTLKGISESVAVYELLRARPREENESRARALGVGVTLLGRDAELAMLQAELDGLTCAKGGGSSSSPVSLVRANPGSSPRPSIDRVRAIFCGWR